MKSDITELDADALVTAANEALCGGGGVDGAIHRAAGPHLLAECQQIGGCCVGDARITAGYDLLATHVIHAVGPPYVTGAESECRLLRSAYLSSLRLACEHKLHHVVFPCISAGVMGFPGKVASGIAVSAVIDWVAANEYPKVVTFCVHSAEYHKTYQRVLKERNTPYIC